MLEIWKPVIGYENLFLISNLGRLKRIKTNKILKQNLNKDGYSICCVSLGNRNNKKCFRIHRLVAESFLINPYCKNQVNHLDGNKLNNCVDNLEWCTCGENIRHAFDTGLNKRVSGELCHLSKLTEIQVLEIRKLYGSFSSRKLAKIYNVNKDTILRIWNNKTWNCLL